MKLVAAAVSLLVILAGWTVPASAGSGQERPPRTVATARGDLPAGGPPALYREEPLLPSANGWPGADVFPRTAGTGRLADGGFFWTDFLYDDHGSTGVSVGNPSVTAGSPSFGTYTYPPGAAHHNGADIFRAAVLRRQGATFWRVDWNTLANPKVPLAVWTFDRDNKSTTGGSAWPAGAGVRSAGIDRALVVSSRGASVVALPSGRTLRRIPVTVDRAAHSFVVEVPDSVLRPTGRWRVRLAAGLANATGTGLARPRGALPHQPSVYNVTFRSRTQEKPSNYNFWNDSSQNARLLTGDVAPFSATINWSRLARRVRTPQPQPRGWSTRWYVSAVDLGPGIVADLASVTDGKANFLGRVQPYSVYVPRGARPRGGWPVTFLLHSLTQNHNQYAATTPKFPQQACQDRRSLCITTLGRGPDGFYWNEAELDFWQVWQQVGAAYRLDPHRTVLSGYSMGGLGTNAIAMAHPDLFAKAVTLAGAVGDVPSLSNLTWVPTYLSGGAADELVPVTQLKAQADRLATLGQRFRWVVYPLTDHVLYELGDDFGDAATYMGNSRRALNPGSFGFTWTPRNSESSRDRSGTSSSIPWTQRPDLGVRTTGAYWVRDLRARTRSVDASLNARSGQRIDRSITPRLTRDVAVTGGPGPGVATTQTWSRGARGKAKPMINLRLQNVSSLRVLLRAAGFSAGQRGTLRVTTDGPTTVRFGKQTVKLGSGRHSVRFRA